MSEYEFYQDVDIDIELYCRVHTLSDADLRPQQTAQQEISYFSRFSENLSRKIFKPQNTTFSPTYLSILIRNFVLSCYYYWLLTYFFFE
jgi:hypothetical protein